jgi:Large polyvalent protein associated domain 23
MGPGLFTSFGRQEPLSRGGIADFGDPKQPDIGGLMHTVLFGGPTAKSADQNKLKEAQRMKAQGADRDAIWSKTGWWEDAGRWNFEFGPEHGVRVHKPANSQLKAGVPLPQTLDYPELYKNYPDAKLGKAIRNDSVGAEAFVIMQTIQEADLNKSKSIPYSHFPAINIPSGSTKGDRYLSPFSMVHETQHAIDNQERTSKVYDSELRGNTFYSKPWPENKLELRATNAGMRDLQMSPQERKAHPPWVTEKPAMDTFYFGRSNFDPFRQDLIRRDKNVTQEFGERRDRALEASASLFEAFDAEENVARRQLTKSGNLTAQAKRDIADIKQKRSDSATVTIPPISKATPPLLVKRQFDSTQPYDDVTHLRYHERPMGPR